MGNELKPCPLCGSESKIDIIEKAYSICSDPNCCGMGDLIVIECQECSCEIKIYSDYNYKRKRRYYISNRIMEQTCN